MRCGLTRLPDGRIMFDRRIKDYEPNKRGSKNGKKKKSVIS